MPSDTLAQLPLKCKSYFSELQNSVYPSKISRRQSAGFRRLWRIFPYEAQRDPVQPLKGSCAGSLVVIGCRYQGLLTRIVAVTLLPPLVQVTVATPTPVAVTLVPETLATSESLLEAEYFPLPPDSSKS